MKIFVFAVGGTGVRVLRSLTMLLASGCKMQPNTTIVPIILDYDLTNGDTKLAEDTLEKYQTVRNLAYADKDYIDDSFFATPIMRLDQIPIAGKHNLKINDKFHVAVEGSNDTFGNYIGYNMLTHSNDAERDLSLTAQFIDALYNNDPDTNSPHKELYLQLERGFKGNPNIGSVVFDKWVQTDEFKFFMANVAQGDRIFVISSIFGGTGAAGFPKMIQCMRTSNNNFVQNAKIGATVIMPYFKFNDSAQSAITSSIFNTKTKAALNYYEASGLNQDINALYYLSDKDNHAHGLYNNEDGGAKQRNYAHIVELLAATSVLDFANKSDAKLTSRKAYEFGLIKNLEQCLNLDHFCNDCKDEFLNDITRFTYFYKFFKDILPSAKQSDAYATKLDILGDKTRKGFYKELNNFLALYEGWMNELGSNTMRKFKPYDINKSTPMHEMLEHKKLKKSFLGGVPLKDDVFHAQMTKAHHEKFADNKTNEFLFLEISRETSKKVLEIAKNH